MSASHANNGSSSIPYAPVSQIGEGVVEDVLDSGSSIHNDNHNNSTVWILGTTVSLAYCCTYFWRYPIFMLPSEYLHSGGSDANANRNMDLQAWFSLAFISGFGSSKLIGMQLLSSAFFFRHRLVCILAMMWTSMLIEGVGVGVSLHVSDDSSTESTSRSILIPTLAVFVSSMIQSWIYGALITYLEGRQQTETLLAAIIAATIAAGGMARGTATLVLEYTTMPPPYMPLAIGIVACTIATICVVVAHAQPPPTAHDQACKSPRLAMSFAQQLEFFRAYGMGVLGLCLAYALLVGVRSFRDFYSEQLFVASYNYYHDIQQQVPSWVYFAVDLPGALLSAFVIYTFRGGGEDEASTAPSDGASRNSASNTEQQSHRTIFARMVSTCMGFGVFVVISTLAFVGHVLNGFWWQVSLGIGIYGSFSILTTAIYDRLIAATRTPGTCTFLVLLSDQGAYVVTLIILLVRDFAPTSGQETNGEASGAEEQQILTQFFPMIFLGVGTGLVTLGFSRQYFQRRLREDFIHGQNLDGNSICKQDMVVMDATAGEDGDFELT